MQVLKNSPHLHSLSPFRAHTWDLDWHASLGSEFLTAAPRDCSNLGTFHIARFKNNSSMLIPQV